MSDSLSAGIARAKILESELALKASKPRDCEYLGAAEQCNSIWDIIPPPEHLYVSMGTNGVRMFTANPEREHDSAVTIYVQESALNEVLDQMQRLLGIFDNQDDFIADDAAQAILTKHGRST